jgi:ubiquitin carboxyl-terminal hydrolase 1
MKPRSRHLPVVYFYAKATSVVVVPLATVFSASVSAAQHPYPHYQRQQHHVTGPQQQFVIVNSEEPQRYKLLGILPFLVNTWNVQFTIAALVTLFFGVPLLLYVLLRPRHPYADWTSRLPDSLVSFLLYWRSESSEFKNIVLSEVMSLVTAPLGLAVDIATTVSPWASIASRKSHSREAKSKPHGSTGRSLLRRSQAGTNHSSTAGSKAQVGSSSHHYAGLYNTGNSCFLNSTLQSLASLDLLKGHLENMKRLAEEWDVPTPVTDALYSLIVELNEPLVKRSALIPRQLTDALSNLPQTNVGSFFYAHQQQDAHELLVLLTSAIDDEMSLIMSERELTQRSQAAGLRAAVAPDFPSPSDLS